MQRTLILRRLRCLIRLCHRGRRRKVAATPRAQKFKQLLTRAHLLKVTHLPALKLVHQGYPSRLAPPCLCAPRPSAVQGVRRVAGATGAVAAAVTAAGLHAARLNGAAAPGGTAPRDATTDAALGTRAVAAPPGGEGSPSTISPVPLRTAALLRAGVEAVPGAAGTARPLLAGVEAPPHEALLGEPAAAAAEGAARPGATPQEGAAHLGATPQEGAGVVGPPLLPVTSREAQPPLL